MFIQKVDIMAPYYLQRLITKENVNLKKKYWKQFFINIQYVKKKKSIKIWRTHNIFVNDVNSQKQFNFFSEFKNRMLDIKQR